MAKKQKRNGCCPECARKMRQAALLPQADGYGFAASACGEGEGAPYGANLGGGAFAAGLGGALGADSGLLQGLPEFLRSRQSEQFLLGALLGAGAAWVLSDEELRGKIVKSVMKLYANVGGALEEVKEQMADIRAEVEAERLGGV